MHIMKGNFTLSVGHLQFQQGRTEKLLPQGTMYSSFGQNPESYKFINERQSNTILSLQKMPTLGPLQSLYLSSSLGPSDCSDSITDKN